ncbi:MAG: FtsQ-type POTRA domain-containing protein [Microthrixaceae bacterium]
MPRDRAVIESAVEPRLVERRRQVRAEAQRTRIRRWIALGVVAAVIALAIVAVLSPLLDVDTVKVRGVNHLTGDEVASATGITKGDHLVSVDLDDARSRLKAEPWIASASVTRHFPGTVEVKIIEEQPLLEFTATDGTLLVSTTGRVLAGATTGESSLEGAGDTALPKVEYAGSVNDLAKGDGASVPTEMVGTHPRGVLDDAVLLIKRITPDLLPTLRVVQIGADRNMTLILSDAAEVKLGQPEDIESKLIATRAVLSQVVLDCLKSIDVREPTRAAVSRGPGCPGISPESASSSTDSSGGSDSGAEGDGADEGT